MGLEADPEPAAHDLRLQHRKRVLVCVDAERKLRTDRNGDADSGFDRNRLEGRHLAFRAARPVVVRRRGSIASPYLRMAPGGEEDERSGNGQGNAHRSTSPGKVIRAGIWF